MFDYLKRIVRPSSSQSQQQFWSRHRYKFSLISSHQTCELIPSKRFSNICETSSCTMNSDLLIDSTTSNKRSLTNHFVDYMKKTKCLVPSSKTCKEQSTKRGSICIAYSINADDQKTLTLHVIRARQLSSTHPDHQSFNTFVKVTFPHQFEQSSKIIHGTNSPVYDETFLIPLTDKNLSKRLTISVYHQSISKQKSADLIGCMSFNMKTLLKTNDCVKMPLKCKWYCLLPESIGRHKRMPLNIESSSKMRRKNSNGLVFNVEIFNRDQIRFASAFPCTVSEVKMSSNCSTNVAMPGDVLLQVNEINVSRTQAKAVNKLIKNLPLPLTLQLYRRSVPSSSSIKIDKIVLNSVDQHEPLNSKMFKKNSSSEKLSSHYEDIRTCPEQSDGSESGVGSESNPYSDGENRLQIVSTSYERDALHLIEIEKEFISQLELGVHFYSRPLKHYLISSTEHGKLFQNIEKILAISRYQLNRLQSLSDRTIVRHIGQIFHEKVQLICEAFTRYTSGYSEASTQLKQLSKCASFQRFIDVNQSTLSIEQFLRLPLNHLENLGNQLDILCCSCENGNDANYLLHVLKELRQCSSYQDSSTHRQHCTTTMTLNSVTGITSSLSNSIEDEQIVELQTRLQSSITLTGRNRHLIFSGVLLLERENKNYIETWAILLNDMLLLTQRNAIDTRLTLICDPISLSEIVDFRSSSERPDAFIFLSTKPTMPLKIRYPSQCLQCAWQTILEQRLKTWQRSIHDDSSSLDSDLE